MEAALGFVEDEGVGAADDDADRLSGLLVRDAGEFDDAGARGGDFFEEVGGAEFFFREGVDVRDGFAAGGLEGGGDGLVGGSMGGGGRGVEVPCR